MGEVYRARDARLGRDAALKVISPRLLADRSVRRRFEIEAKAASVLNHPAIVTVYDIGETGEVSWIAMEWVEGRTLREALAAGALPLGQVLSIARDIAEGLAAAHSKGVVHRDLKPENIMLRVDGRAKILDFGLARQTILEPTDATPSDQETAARGAATFEGTILGTIGYMSPEQAAGRTVDFRSDQFAFGLLVYEMLAGRRAFERASLVETLAAIIRDEPVSLSSLRPGTPESLVRLIARCLAKAPDDRFSSTSEVAALIASITDAPVRQPEISGGTSFPTEVRGVALPAPSTKASGRRTELWVGLVVVLIVSIAGITAWMRLPRSPAGIGSLAVLPFQNATKNPEVDYLANGLTESLIDQMSRVPSLKVMARTTVARYGAGTDPRTAGRQLGVAAVLAGTVSRRGDQLLVTAELVEISTGARLWGETYDRPAADLLRVQDSIAWEITDGLRLGLSGQEKRSLVARTTENPQAYEAFLKARVLLQHDNEDDDLEARRLFLQAIEDDPKFADAYLGVASTYARSAGNGYARPTEAWSEASEFARKALELDPGNFGARVSLAVRHFQFDWDWPLAEREFEQLSRDPRMAGSMYYQPAAIFYWVKGRPDRSVALMERALRLDPRNVEARVMMADLQAEAGRLDESIGGYRAIIQDEPADPRPLFGLAGVLRRRGDIATAVEGLRKAYQLTDEQAGITALANANSAKSFDDAQMSVARYRLEDLQALARERYVSAVDLARLQAAAGDREMAFALLERALAEKAPGLVFLKLDKMWDPIRDDARFKEIVTKVGIP